MFLFFDDYPGTVSTNQSIKSDTSDRSSSEKIIVSENSEKVSESKVPTCSSTQSTIPPSSTNTDSTTITPPQVHPVSTSSDKMQLLLDLVGDLSKQRTRLPTSSSSSSTCTPMETFLSLVKSKQMPPAATPLPTQPTTSGVTKEDFESFKKEMFLLSKSNTESKPSTTQSMPGEY